MPSKNKFDDILKNKFEGFEAPLPKGGFSAIKDRIPEKNKPKFLLPFLTAASLFFATLSGYLFLKQYDNENRQLTTSNEIEVETKHTPKSSVKTTETIVVESKNIGNNSNTNTQNKSKNNRFISYNAKPNFINNDKNNKSSLSNKNDTFTTKNSMFFTKHRSINPVLLRHIFIPFTSLASRELIGTTSINITNNTSDEKEEKNIEKTFRLGISISPIYLGKRVLANANDDIYISNFSEINKLTTEKAGFNTALLLSKTISKKLTLVSKLDITQMKDINKFELLEKLDSPELISTEGNSMVLSSYKKENITNISSYIYTGLHTGLQYTIGNSSYVALTNGIHYLLSSTEGNNTIQTENTNLNFSSSFAIGKTFKLNNSLQMAVEPELKLFYKSFQENGTYKSKPYTFGINFIVMK